MSAARHAFNQTPLYIGMEWNTLIGEIKDTVALDFSIENTGIQTVYAKKKKKDRMLFRLQSSNLKNITE